MKFLSNFLTNFLAIALALVAAFLLIFACAYLANIHPLLGGLAAVAILAAAHTATEY